MPSSTSPNLRQRLAPVLFLALLTAAFLSLVTAAHLASRPIVEQSRLRYLQRAVLEAAGWSVPPRADELADLFASRARLLPEEPDGPFAVVQDPQGRDDRVVFLEEGRGLWGPIRAAVAFSSLEGSLAGIAWIAHNETPGLGARIEEPEFRRQFRGKRPPLKLAPLGRPDAGDRSTMQAITGATISSQAVLELINRAASRFKPSLEHVAPTEPDMILSL